MALKLERRSLPLSKLAVVLVLLGAVLPVGAQTDDVVWVWNDACPAPSVINATVRLDGVAIFVRPLATCRWDREFGKGKVSFDFTAKREIVWYGYRSDEGDGRLDPGDRTPAGTSFKVDVWQAGGEQRSILLGYTVVASDGIHMNSIHIVSPTERSVTTMAPGLVLETEPIRPR